MGVPAPGWGLLGLAQVGSIGPNDDTIGEVARKMYLAGYDCRHFVTQSISVATVDLVLWIWFALRERLDPAWRGQVEQERAISGTTGVRHHPRFEAMALGAHLIACAANAGKITLYGGSPYAFNYAQWLRFAHAAFRFSARYFASPSDQLTRRAETNADALSFGWPPIDFSSSEAPRLAVDDAR
jgi:hypothetical protein